MEFLQVYENLATRVESSSEGASTRPGSQPGVVAPATNALTPEMGALVWIQYMRFSRRSEDVRSSRLVILCLKLFESLKPKSLKLSSLPNNHAI